MAKRKRKRGSGTILSVLIILVIVIICAAAFVFAARTSLFSDSDYSGETEAVKTRTKVAQTEDTASVVLESETTAEETTNTLPIYAESPNRVTYAEGFYYEPVSDNAELMERIRNLSYNEANNTLVTFDMLSYVRVLYIDYDDNEQEGEIVCSSTIARFLTEIFYDLYQARYQIAGIRLVDDFNADDDLSLEANNTSAFNFRLSTGSTDHLSAHAYGLAIDINPIENPYVYTDKEGNVTILPASGAVYADRSLGLAHMITETDLCYELFTRYGFTWGGSWKSVKDYQHFEYP